MHFELSDLRVFLSVAQLGSFKRASEDCAVTLPAVSLRMKKLEENFEAPLFVRKSRGVELTEAGHRLRDEALKVMLAARDLQTTMAIYAKHHQNTLVVHASLCPMDSHLPQVIAPFMREHPEIHFEFTAEHSEDVVKAVASGRADFGAVSFPLDYYGVQFLPMNPDEFVLATPAESGADLPRGCGSGVSQRDMTKIKLYALGTNVLIQSHIERLFERMGLKLNIVARIPTMNAALHVAGLTGGWVVASRSALGNYQGKLRMVQINEPWAKLSTQIVIPSDETRLTKNTALFVKFFRELTKKKEARKGQ